MSRPREKNKRHSITHHVTSVLKISTLCHSNGESCFYFDSNELTITFHVSSLCWDEFYADVYCWNLKKSLSMEHHYAEVCSYPHYNFFRLNYVLHKDKRYLPEHGGAFGCFIPRRDSNLYCTFIPRIFQETPWFLVLPPF